MDADSFRPGRRTIIEGVAGLALLALAFSAIAASDVSVTGTRAFWTGIVAVFAASAYVSDWMHPGPVSGGAGGALRMALHWIGVLVAVQLVFFFVDSGRMANADTGLSNSLILSLGAYLSGVHGNWRMIVLGVALACAAVGVAFVEQYLWVLLGIAVLAFLALLFGSRLRQRHARGASEAE